MTRKRMCFVYSLSMKKDHALLIRHDFYRNRWCMMIFHEQQYVSSVEATDFMSRYLTQSTWGGCGTFYDIDQNVAAWQCQVHHLAWDDLHLDTRKSSLVEFQRFSPGSALCPFWDGGALWWQAHNRTREISFTLLLRAVLKEAWTSVVLWV